MFQEDTTLFLLPVMDWNKPACWYLKGLRPSRRTAVALVFSSGASILFGWRENESKGILDRACLEGLTLTCVFTPHCLHSDESMTSFNRSCNATYCLDHRFLQFSFVLTTMEDRCLLQSLSRVWWLRPANRWCRRRGDTWWWPGAVVAQVLLLEDSRITVYWAVFQN